MLGVLEKAELHFLASVAAKIRSCDLDSID